MPFDDELPVLLVVLRLQSELLAQLNCELNVARLALLRLIEDELRC